jgi:hypothetical protein
MGVSYSQRHKMMWITCAQLSLVGLVPKHQAGPASSGILSISNRGFEIARFAPPVSTGLGRCGDAV